MDDHPPQFDISSGLLNAVYLGTPDTLDSSQFPLRRAVFHGHEVVLIGHFRDEHDYERWLRRAEEIRLVSARLRDLKEEGDITYDEYERRLRDDWLSFIDLFITDFGKEMMPQDIRWAVHNIQANMNIDLVSFPPFLPCNITPTLRGIDLTLAGIIKHMPSVIYWNHRSKIFEFYTSRDNKVYRKAMMHLKQCFVRGIIRSIDKRNPIVVEGRRLHTLQINIENVQCHPYLLLRQRAGDDGPAFTPYFFCREETRDRVFEYLNSR
jgi:hypothetical protein